MNICCIDEGGCLYISPRIDDWQFLEEHEISVVIDLEGDLDAGVPTLPNHVLYLYYPIFDEDLPNLDKLHAVACLGATLVKAGQKVLSHCGMGFNRSALVAGLILVHLGMSGEDAFTLLRVKRQGALFNDVFAAYLRGLTAPP
jgi:protein-tyrosine phosphatase